MKSYKIDVNFGEKGFFKRGNIFTVIRVIIKYSKKALVTVRGDTL